MPSKSRTKRSSLNLRRLSSEMINSATSKQKTKKSRTKKGSLNRRRLSSEIIKSATPKQKKELSIISLEMAEVHEHLIQYKEKGLLKEFLRDVCKLNKEMLLKLCELLTVNASISQSYEEICNKIITDRPDLFKLLTFNKWKKWGALLVGVIIGGLSSWFNQQSIGLSSLFSGAIGFTWFDSYYKTKEKLYEPDEGSKEWEIATAIHFLIEINKILKDSEIKISYSRSHSKTKRRRRS